MEEHASVYEFCGFRLDVARRLLLEDGRPVALGARALDLLVVLVRNGGLPVTKDELISAVWQNATEDNVLARTISSLRKALRDGQQGRRLIATIPGRGYQFVAAVHEIHEAIPVVPPQRRWSWRLASIAALAALTVTAAASRVPHTERCVAVLPFAALSGVAPTAAATLADALIAGLGTTRRVGVRHALAVMDDDLSRVDVRALGQDLKVDRLVDGRVQRIGSQIRVSVRIIDVNRATPIWSDAFEQRFTGRTVLQEALVARVITAVRRNLSIE